MDLGRTSFTGTIQYVQNDPLQRAGATWYRAAPTALPFPGAHAFGLPVWDSIHGLPTAIGWDATVPLHYYNGKRINSSLGQVVAGPLSWFLDGAPSPGSLPRCTDGTPQVCVGPPWGIYKGGQSIRSSQARGEVGKSGTAKVSGVPCPFCPTTTPAAVQVTLSGFVGIHAGFNGTWTLPQQGFVPCTYLSTISPGFVVRAARLPGGWQIQMDQGAFGNGQYDGGSSDCVASTVLSLTFTTCGGGPNATLLPL